MERFREEARSMSIDAQDVSSIDQQRKEKRERFLDDERKISRGKNNDPWGVTMRLQSIQFHLNGHKSWRTVGGINNGRRRKGPTYEWGLLGTKRDIPEGGGSIRGVTERNSTLPSFVRKVLALPSRGGSRPGIPGPLNEKGRGSLNSLSRKRS